MRQASDIQQSCVLSEVPKKGNVMTIVRNIPCVHCKCTLALLSCSNPQERKSQTWHNSKFWIKKSVITHDDGSIVHVMHGWVPFEIVLMLFTVIWRRPSFSYYKMDNWDSFHFPVQVKRKEKCKHKGKENCVPRYWMVKVFYIWS